MLSVLWTFAEKCRNLCVLGEKIEVDGEQPLPFLQHSNCDIVTVVSSYPLPFLLTMHVWFYLVLQV